MNVLVTGGAGYIGSHTALLLREAGHRAVAYDDLSTGHRWAAEGGTLVEGSVLDGKTLREALRRNGIEAVLHFAATSTVTASFTTPLVYYDNNTRGMIELLAACLDVGVHKVVFSSTAAVYGLPRGDVIAESDPFDPISPYGASKAMSERILRDVSAASPLRFVALRYFNAAGADPHGRLGEVHEPETHLVPLAVQAALGRRPGLTVFGTDYPTPDGTCIRDYVHVWDLAQAHLDALTYLEAGGESAALNCGYGRGFSVREVIDMVHAVSGRSFPVETGERRAGDPPVLVADGQRIRRILGWQPRHDDLGVIVRHALNWELSRMEGEAAAPGRRAN